MTHMSEPGISSGMGPIGTGVVRFHLGQNRWVTAQVGDDGRLRLHSPDGRLDLYASASNSLSVDVLTSPEDVMREKALAEYRGKR